MKKITFLLCTVLFFTFANATNFSKIEKNKAMFFSKTLYVTAYDACGQKLTFTVTCGSCSWGDLGHGADDFIHSHTDSHGCFFLSH
ncbi:MAG: hypothetical protein WCP74_04065 [Sphingobacteriia bacterium]|jgi:hypothetical protein